MEFLGRRRTREESQTEILNNGYVAQKVTQRRRQRELEESFQTAINAGLEEEKVMIMTTGRKTFFRVWKYKYTREEAFNRNSDRFYRFELSFLENLDDPRRIITMFNIENSDYAEELNEKETMFFIFNNLNNEDKEKITDYFNDLYNDNENNYRTFRGDIRKNIFFSATELNWINLRRDQVNVHGAVLDNWATFNENYQDRYNAFRRAHPRFTDLSRISNMIIFMTYIFTNHLFYFIGILHIDIILDTLFIRYLFDFPLEEYFEENIHPQDIYMAIKLLAEQEEAPQERFRNNMLRDGLEFEEIMELLNEDDFEEFVLFEGHGFIADDASFLSTTVSDDEAF